MYIGLDIGGTAVKYGLVADDGVISEKGKIPTPKEEDAFLSALTGVVKQLTAAASEPVKGIGVSAPGVVSADGVMTTFGALLKMYGMPLREKLSALTGLTVAVENDGNAAAIAEHWLGGARDLNNYIVMVLGTGLGGGFVVNGELYRGGHGMAGELGWPLYHGLPSAGNIERWSENFHSPTVLGLLDSYNRAADSWSDDVEPLDSAVELIELVQSGDLTPCQVFDSYLTDLSTNILNLFAIFDPEAILLGGGISENEFVMTQLTERLDSLVKRHEALNRVRQLGILGELRKAELGNDAGLLGGVYSVKKVVEK